MEPSARKATLREVCLLLWFGPLLLFMLEIWQVWVWGKRGDTKRDCQPVLTRDAVLLCCCLLSAGEEMGST